MIWVIVSTKQATATKLKVRKEIAFENSIHSLNIDARAKSNKTKLNQKTQGLLIREPGRNNKRDGTINKIRKLQ